MRKPLFRKTKRLAIIVSAMVLSSIFLAACGENSPSILNAAGPVAAQERDLFYIILGIATFIFIVVEGWLILSIVMYRERPGAPSPRQIHGNNTVEIIWTAAPAVFLFIVLGATIYYMFNLTNFSQSNKLTVNVVAHQWWWEFDYKNYPGFNGHSIVTADSMHVPVGVAIEADLSSNNVIHSFWVPALSGKLDVIPGHNNRLLFKADTPGTYPGECAEFCGSQHAHMHFDVVVDSPDAFNTWISAQEQMATPPSSNGVNCSPANGAPIAQGDLVACGAKFFAQGACVGCHGIVGVNLSSYDDPKAANLIGPNLTHFGSRDLIAGGVLPNTPDNLATWLADPQKVKPGVDMPNLGLSQSQINALVAYLESLK